MALRCFIVSTFCCGQNKAFWSAGIQALESDRPALNSQYCYLFRCMILGNSLISEHPALISKIQTTVWVCAPHVPMSIKQAVYSNIGMALYQLGRDREMWLHGNELLESSPTFTTKKGRNSLVFLSNTRREWRISEVRGPAVSVAARWCHCCGQTLYRPVSAGQLLR